MDTYDLAYEAWHARVEEARMKPAVDKVLGQYGQGLLTVTDMVLELHALLLDSAVHSEERRAYADGYFAERERPLSEEQVGAWLRTVAVLG